MIARPRSTLTIGEVAAAAEVGVETIRFYHRQKLLAEPPKPDRSIRRYGPHDVARVVFIKSAQRLGFRLDEVANLLALEDGAHCDEVRALAEQKLGQVRDRLQDLRRMEAALNSAVRECSRTRGKVSCPLISSLGGRRATTPEHRAHSPQRLPTRTG